MRHALICTVIGLMVLTVAGQSLVGVSRKEKSRVAGQPSTAPATGTAAIKPAAGSSTATDSLTGLSKKKAATPAGSRTFTNRDLDRASGSISQSRVPDSVARAAQPKGGPGRPRSVAPQSAPRPSSPTPNLMSPVGAAGVSIPRSG